LPARNPICASGGAVAMAGILARPSCAATALVAGVFTSGYNALFADTLHGRISSSPFFMVDRNSNSDSPSRLPARSGAGEL
jgi:hypothetical protein